MDKLNQLKDIIKNSQNIVFFGGAGVSTKSDIPDFRSENGVFKSIAKYRYPPEQMLSHSFFEDHPDEFYKFYYDELNAICQAKPNLAHKALAKLENEGKLKGIITQNIDNLHQAAGSKAVYQLHGSAEHNYCLNCGLSYNANFILEQRPDTPHCLDCGCIIRPDIILYEEPVKNKIIKISQKLIANAEVLIIGGTSLAVYPTAGLINSFNGDKLIFINKETIDQCPNADLKINDSLGRALSYATQ